VPLTLSERPDVTFLENTTVGPVSDVVPPAIQPGAARPLPRPIDVVEEWGLQSFPASDPPANW